MMSEKIPIKSQKVTFSNSYNGKCKGRVLGEKSAGFTFLKIFLREKNFECDESLSAVTNPNFIPDNNPNDENNKSESISPSVSTNQNQVPSNQSEQNIQPVPSSITVDHQQPASDKTRNRFIKYSESRTINVFKNFHSIMPGT